MEVIRKAVPGTRVTTLTSASDHNLWISSTVLCGCYGDADCLRVRTADSTYHSAKTSRTKLRANRNAGGRTRLANGGAGGGTCRNAGVEREKNLTALRAQGGAAHSDLNLRAGGEQAGRGGTTPMDSRPATDAMALGLDSSS
ncbi:hypothetical protein SRHO_G00116800 [Serrasalmus rhombeus]